jgi:hypothetical protein
MSPIGTSRTCRPPLGTTAFDSRADSRHWLPGHPLPGRAMGTMVSRGNRLFGSCGAGCVRRVRLPCERPHIRPSISLAISWRPKSPDARPGLGRFLPRSQEPNHGLHFKFLAGLSAGRRPSRGRRQRARDRHMEAACGLFPAHATRSRPSDRALLGASWAVPGSVSRACAGRRGVGARHHAARSAQT